MPKRELTAGKGKDSSELDGTSSYACSVVLDSLDDEIGCDGRTAWPMTDADSLFYAHCRLDPVGWLEVACACHSFRSIPEQALAV